MTPDRLDHLLDEAFATGAIPPDATADERARLEEMLAGAAVLQRAAGAVDSEAGAAMPVARARFQRHMAARANTPHPLAGSRAARPRAGFLGGLFGSVGALRLAASAAAIGLVALAAILVTQPFSGVETASALSIDDYVQVQGVVSETADGYVTVQSSEFGRLRIAVSDATSILDSDAPRDRAQLRAGDTVLISGVVRQAHKKDIRIEANTLALARNGPKAAPTVVAVRQLRSFEEGIEGTVTVLAIAPEGRSARILLDTGRGHQLVVNVDRASAERLVGSASSALGARVRIVRDEALPGGVFRCEPVDADSPGPGPGNPHPPGGRPGMDGPAARPDLVHVEGVIAAREGAQLTVETADGAISVLLRPHTRILIGRSGLTLESARAGETAIGHEVIVRGGRDPRAGAVIADVIVLGPRSGQ